MSDLDEKGMEAVKALVIAAGVVHSKLAAPEGQVTILDQAVLKDALAGIEPFYRAMLAARPSPPKKEG